MQSGRVPIDNPTIFSKVSTSSYFSFKFSSGAYVFVNAWKYAIYLLILGHFLCVISFCFSYCSSNESPFNPPENSPLPSFEQYIQPP